MEAKQLIEQVLGGNDLDYEQASWMMNQVMDGQFTHIQMASILTALRAKKESVTEITACAAVMREKSTKIPVSSPLVIDTCGTGGDASGSFNISTTVALLLAGSGYKVAKHGNRSMTSKSGSADLLEALGININLNPQQVADCIEQVNIGFLFAPALHSAMKNVMPVRKELGIRTVFNILGPLTNPAGAQVQVIGLYDETLVPKIIEVLKALGTRSAYVFSGLSGLDEVCISSNTRVCHLDSEGNISEFIFNPEDYGFTKSPIQSIKGGTPEQNADISTGILKGEIDGPMRDVVAINSGFAIAAVDECSLEQAFDKAANLLKEGVGYQAVEKLKSFSNSF